MTATVPDLPLQRPQADVAEAVQLAPVASVGTWPPLREMDAAIAQASFHDLMEAFSLPGTIRTLPTGSFAPPIPAAVVPLLALADLMTPLAGLGDDGNEAVDAIARLTGAPVAGREAARFALALEDPGDFTGLNIGSHWSPEKGATLVQRVASLESSSPSPGDWKLSGPGIPPHEPRIVRISGLPNMWLSHRQALVSDYPAGADCLLITDEGEFIALSRTTVIEVI